MPRNDDGEFELVLGNRQLLTVFLIVVVLLGAFFSMGFILGKNSTATVTADTRTPPSNSAVATDRIPPPPEQPAPAPATRDQSDPAALAADAKPSPAPPVTTHAVQAEQEAAAPAPARPVTHEKPVEAAARTLPSDPAPGEYWQVAATSRPDAEIVTEALTKKGFKAILAPAPREGLFRVLIGPFTNAANMAESRSKLESAGFKNPIMRRY